MRSALRATGSAAVLCLSLVAGARATAEAAGELCLAPFHATPPPDSPPGVPPPPPPPGEPDLSDTTWAPQHNSHFTFSINGRERAKLGDGETAYLTDLPTNKPLRVKIRLDDKPFETFSLDLSKYDHRVCLWLYPGYWHWIDNGWDAKLGCKCGEDPEAAPAPSFAVSASRHSKIYVHPSESLHTFHVAYAPTWSLEERDGSIVLSAPDHLVSVRITSHMSEDESPDACASALLQGQGEGVTALPTRFSLITMNWRAVTLEARDRHAGDTEDTIHFSACLKTSTALAYPIVAISTTARASLFVAHRDAIQDILGSVHFRPAA